MGRLENKVALVVGGAELRGIGEATAAMMAREGAKVIIADLESSAVAASASALRAEGLAVTHGFVDLRNEAGIAAMVDAAIDLHGRIDILFNNVALTGNSPGMASDANADINLLGMDADVWRRTFDINVVGLALTIKHVLPHMIAAGGGSIVNTSSVAARRYQAVLSAYQVSKAAVEALTGVVAASFGKQGIRCNAVAPGTTLTANVEKVLTPERRELSRKFYLIPDLAMPDDQAAAVVFLASDEARSITGHTIVVDGGMTVQMPYYPILRDSHDSGMA